MRILRLLRNTSKVILDVFDAIILFIILNYGFTHNEKFLCSTELFSQQNVGGYFASIVLDDNWRKFSSIDFDGRTLMWWIGIHHTLKICLSGDYISPNIICIAPKVWCNCRSILIVIKNHFYTWEAGLLLTVVNDYILLLVLWV
jgi:hypothetical protein